MPILTRTSELVIRPAERKDVAAVIRLDEQITDLEKPEYWQERFERYGQRENRFFLVAEAADDIFAGFIIGEIRAWEFGSPPSGWVFAIGVNPDLRLAKVGSTLFETLCKCLKDAGADTVRTMLAREDQLNMSFFRSQGMMGGPFIELEMPLTEFAGGGS